MSNKEIVEVKEAKKSIKNSKGILLVALNHPYYGHYAFQLALSIKSNDPDVNISIAHDGVGISYLDANKLSIFDKTIKIKDDMLKVGGRKEVLKFKAYLYDITPYSETLYLDADILWLNKRSVSEFIKTIPEEVNFTMQNRGFLDLKNDEQLDSNFSIWVNSKELKETYGFKSGKLFNLSSELIYFKKTKEVAEYFKQVKIEFSAIKVNYVNFNGGVPDELPFAIAMIKNDFYPHESNWRPIYWEAFDKKRMLNKIQELNTSYFAVSFGGNLQENFIKKFYNNLAQFYCNRFAVQHVFPLKDKRTFIKERHTI